MHIMIDLETLGTHPGCMVTEIGLVAFGAVGVMEHEHIHIDVSSYDDRPVGIEYDTLQWWLTQKRDPLPNTLYHTIDEALTLCTQFFNFTEDIQGVWGNGATFDNMILRSLYELNKRECPWSFRVDRCYRTLKNLLPHLDQHASEKPHCALADAQAQAKNLRLMLKELKCL